jgi:hypothetical protein
VALGVTVTFAAYLIGTFFNEMRGLVARLYLGVRRTAGSPHIVERRTDSVTRARERSLAWRRRVVDRWRDLINLKRILDSPQRLFKGRVLLGIPKMIMEFLIGVGIGALAIPLLLFSGLISLGAKLLDWTEAAVMRLARWLIGIRIEPYKPFLSKQGVGAVERYLEGKSGPFRAGVKPGVADVIADFPVIRTRLIHRSAVTANEYDRLRAEADFRSAIVPPLLAILCIFVFEVSPLWILTAPLLLVLLATARSKRREGGDILADALGVVDAPSAEPRPEPLPAPR